MLFFLWQICEWILKQRLTLRYLTGCEKKCARFTTCASAKNVRPPHLWALNLIDNFAKFKLRPLPERAGFSECFCFLLFILGKKETISLFLRCIFSFWKVFMSTRYNLLWENAWIITRISLPNLEGTEISNLVLCVQVCIYVLYGKFGLSNVHNLSFLETLSLVSWKQGCYYHHQLVILKCFTRGGRSWLDNSKENVRNMEEKKPWNNVYMWVRSAHDAGRMWDVDTLAPCADGLTLHTKYTLKRVKKREASSKKIVPG